MSGQLHQGTILRALFAGGIAIWSKAATIAKVRPVSRGRTLAESGTATREASRSTPRSLGTVTSSRGSPSRPSVPLSPQAGGGVAGKAAFAAGAGAVGYSAVAAPKTDPQAKAK